MQIARLQSLAERLQLSGWVIQLARLNNICLDAAHYRNSLAWHTRYEALQQMITNLNTISYSPEVSEHRQDIGKHKLGVILPWQDPSRYQIQLRPRYTARAGSPWDSPEISQGVRLSSTKYPVSGRQTMSPSKPVRGQQRGLRFESVEAMHWPKITRPLWHLLSLRSRYDLSVIVRRWQDTAQHELDKLQQESQKTDQINNPYVVGQALQPGTSLFVGRHDLVLQLEQSLNRGSHRPTFFLNGERRMGKSSTLRQLPHLLDTRHFLPIFFDLQAPEMTANIAAFLEAIAEKMVEALKGASLQVKALEKHCLQKAQQDNEAQVYYVFNEWLKDIEQVLVKSNRIILLSLDEFESLEMVGQAKYLDLHLLLNWFRSVLQNRPQLALLFSGGKSVSEMGMETGINWSGYFVNVQTFRVSFLSKVEARQLITQPLPDYPIERIFGTGVVDEIIRVTGCHPFLVQAVCSNLVNNLNADERNCADISDVEIAVRQVLEDWEDGYFQDLWIRTDHEQRTCLIALNKLGKANLAQIAQQMYDSQEVTHNIEQTVKYKLQILLKRDLVLFEDGLYHIATPIFSQWVERNS